jgi:hypothetical protein
MNDSGIRLVAAPVDGGPVQCFDIYVDGIWCGSRRTVKQCMLFLNLPKKRLNEKQTDAMSQLEKIGPIKSVDYHEDTDCFSVRFGTLQDGCECFTCHGKGERLFPSKPTGWTYDVDMDPKVCWPDSPPQWHAEFMDSLRRAPCHMCCGTGWNANINVSALILIDSNGGKTSMAQFRLKDERKQAEGL